MTGIRIIITDAKHKLRESYLKIVAVSSGNLGLSTIVLNVLFLVDMKQTKTSCKLEKCSGKTLFSDLSLTRKNTFHVSFSHYYVQQLDESPFLQRLSWTSCIQNRMSECFSMRPFLHVSIPPQAFSRWYLHKRCRMSAFGSTDTSDDEEACVGKNRRALLLETLASCTKHYWFRTETQTAFAEKSGARLTGLDIIREKR